MKTKPRRSEVPISGGSAPYFDNAEIEDVGAAAGARSVDDQDREKTTSGKSVSLISRFWPLKKKTEQQTKKMEWKKIKMTKSCLKRLCCVTRGNERS